MIHSKTSPNINKTEKELLTLPNIFTGSETSDHSDLINYLKVKGETRSLSPCPFYWNNPFSYTIPLIG